MCTDMPSMTVPKLTKSPALSIPNGGQTGQVVGVPGENVMYVIGHKNGRVHIVMDGKTVLPMSLVEPPISVATGGNNEQGLLSMALHPNFKTNQLFYLMYTAAGGGAIKVDEYKRMSATTSMMVRNVRSHNGSNNFHNGGSIYFNPKDPPDKAILYMATGNAQSGGNSQNITNPNGKILRFGAADNTGIPAMGATGHTYASGLRNPYRMSIDRLTGDIWIGEVADGPGGSVLYIPYGKEMLTNFGYGNGGTSAGISGQQPGSAALIGGVVYRGTKIPGLCGRYFFGMHAGGGVRSLIQMGGQRIGNVVNHPELGLGSNISSFGEDGEGEIWMSSMGNSIFKIVAAP
jgi:glucose/sorbosone dehydrogenase